MDNFIFIDKKIRNACFVGVADCMMLFRAARTASSRPSAVGYSSSSESSTSITRLSPTAVASFFCFCMSYE